MKKLLVSICCITYNHEYYLKDALDGFLMQKTNFPFEIVISDDCSKDGTRQIIAEYKKKYPNLIRDVSPEKNMGSSANFIYVQQCAKGKYVAICEGDDYWTDPLKLQKQVDVLEDDETLMACCTNCSIVDNHSQTIASVRAEQVVKDNKQGRYNLRDFFRDNHQYPTLTMLYRNVYKDEIADKYAYTQNKFLGDWTMWICLLIYGDVYFINEVTAAYRINPSSLTHTVGRVERTKANIEICRKVADILPEEYADVAADLRDTRFEWATLVFAYKAEKRYIGMIGCLLVACVLCPNTLWRTINSRIKHK